MADQYVVTGPLVIARTSDGTLIYVYKDAGLPDSVPVKEAERLVETGLVAKVEMADVVLDPADEQPEETGAEKPSATASKSKWVAFAVSQGVPAEEAEASSRDELAARFAG